jgi:hypothetical protein
MAPPPVSGPSCAAWLFVKMESITVKTPRERRLVRRDDLDARQRARELTDPLATHPSFGIVRGS